jgi:hypothetical protein
LLLANDNADNADDANNANDADADDADDERIEEEKRSRLDISLDRVE